jgi:hypothetical protein
LADGAVGDFFQFASGGAANDQNPGRGSDARLEVQTDKSNDEATGTFDRNIGDPNRFFGAIHQSIYESSAGKIQLGCH